MKITIETAHFNVSSICSDENTLDDVLEDIVLLLRGVGYQIDGLEHLHYKINYNSLSPRNDEFPTFTDEGDNNED